MKEHRNDISDVAKEQEHRIRYQLEDMLPLLYLQLSPCRTTFHQRPVEPYCGGPSGQNSFQNQLHA